MSYDSEALDRILEGWAPKPKAENFLGCLPPNRIPEDARPSGDPRNPTLMATYSLNLQGVDGFVRFGTLQIVLWVNPGLGSRPLDFLEEALASHLEEAEGDSHFTFMADDRARDPQGTDKPTGLWTEVLTIPYAASGGA